MEAFERLPGIGPKTAQRLTFYLLQVPESEVSALADAVANLKISTVICSVCKNVAEKDPCDICQDPARDRSVICVVESALDVLAIEKSGLYKGLYHVLGGALNPLENIGPDELFIDELMKRLGDIAPSARTLGDLKESLRPSADNQGANLNGRLGGASVAYESLPVREVILATNPTMEGEATAMYLKRMIGEMDKRITGEIKITRIGHGLPIGAALEYADERTLGKALEGRREY